MVAILNAVADEIVSEDEGYIGLPLEDATALRELAASLPARGERPDELPEGFDLNTLYDSSDDYATWSELSRENRDLRAEVSRLTSSLSEARAETERLTDVAQGYNSERHTLINKNLGGGLTAAETRRLTVVTEITRAFLTPASVDDYSGMLDALRRSATSRAKLDAMLAEIESRTSNAVASTRAEDAPTP